MVVTFDGDMLRGISFTWTFDDMFSNMILADYDPKHTGQFDAAHVKAIKEGAFDNLENYHYFIALAVGKKQLSHFKIERFAPTVADKTKLVYTFFVPLDVPVQPTDQAVRVTVYDDSYYVAFDLLHLDDVTVQAGQDVACNLSVEKTKVKPLWPGQYMPDQLVIRFKGSS
jgi:tRNA threonylcarbamoyladenosine biosynthesis protein TsaE